MRVENQNAFVLRTRSYLETSLLVDIFSREYGRVRLVSKGAKRGKSLKSHKLQPFSELSLSWQGRSELKNLTTLDGGSISLDNPRRLVYGMYLNELLFFLVGELDAHPYIYDLYSQSLTLLNHTESVELVLRRFEFGLLEDLGYGIDFSVDTNGRQLEREVFYQYQPDLGFIPVSRDIKGAIPGHAIVDIYEHDLGTPLALKAAKMVCKTQINLLLNGRELQSRKWHTVHSTAK